MIYLFVMLLCLISFLLTKKNKYNKQCFLVLVSIIFFISALRYNVGKDYQHWHEVYSWINEGLPGGNYVEIGYRLLNVIFQYIPGHMYTLYAFISGTIVFSFSHAITKYVKKDYWFLSLFLFLGTGIFFASLNLVRQYIAIVIVLLATPFLAEKKYVKYILCIIAAGLFHTSSYVMLPFLLMYILLKRENKNTFKILIALYMLSLIFMIIDIRNVFELFKFIIPYRWKWYLESDFFTNRNYSAIVKQIVPNAILIYTFTQMKKIKFNQTEKIFFLMLFVNVFITNCFFGVLVLLRLSYFFDIALLFILPKLLEHATKENKKFGYFCTTCTFLYYFLLTIVTIVLMNGHGVMPYSTIFSIILS